MAGRAVAHFGFTLCQLQPLDLGASSCRNATATCASVSGNNKARVNGILPADIPSGFSSILFGPHRSCQRRKRCGVLRCQASGDGVKPGGGNGRNIERRAVSEALVRALEAQKQAGGLHDPLEGVATAASSRLQQQLDKAQGISVVEADEGGPPQGWEDWQKVFQEVEEREPLLKALEAQLADAVAREEFREAGRLKAAIKALEGEDVVREIVNMFETAVKEERFDEASQLRDAGCAGLVGWWAGTPLSDREYSGALLRIVPGNGKLTGYAMTPKHLVEGGPGQEVLEVHVVKDKAGGYHQQAVYLKRESPFRPDPVLATDTPAAIETTAADNESPVLKVIATSDDPSGDGGVSTLRKELSDDKDDDNVSSDDDDVISSGAADVAADVSGFLDPDSGAEGDVESGPEGAAPAEDEEEAGMQRVIKYFKDRIPGVNFRVSRVIAPKGKQDVPGLIEKLVLGLQEAIAQGSGEPRGKDNEPRGTKETPGGPKKKSLRGGDDGSVELFEEAARLEDEKLVPAQAEINAAAAAEPLDVAGEAPSAVDPTAENAGSQEDSDGVSGSVADVSDSEGMPDLVDDSLSESDSLTKKPDSDGGFSFMGLDVDLKGPTAVGELTSSDRERLEAQAQPVRVPAKVTKARGTFAFSVEDPDWAGEGRTDESGLNSDEAAVRAAVKAGALSPQDVQAMVRVVELSKVKNIMPKKQLEALMGAVAAHRMSQRGGLARKMLFRKLDPALINSTDPLSGMYVGGYGPHGLELIQLQRNFGRWDEGPAFPSTSAGSGDDAYEYVEGVKVTGDPNVPAGKLTFRAKVGPKYKLPPVEYANVDLGTVARYKGQGQLAKPGFKNAHWVDGELLVLDGRLGPQLGFLFDAPAGKGRPVLILFDRWKLPELNQGITA